MKIFTCGIKTVDSDCPLMCDTSLIPWRETLSCMLSVWSAWVSGCFVRYWKVRRESRLPPISTSLPAMSHSTTHLEVDPCFLVSFLFSLLPPLSNLPPLWRSSTTLKNPPLPSRPVSRSLQVTSLTSSLFPSLLAIHLLLWLHRRENCSSSSSSVPSSITEFRHFCSEWFIITEGQHVFCIIS